MLNFYILIIWALIVTLALKIANILFFTQYWFMLMPHHNKFGYKWLSSSEDKYYHPDKTWTHRYSNSTQNPNQLSINVLSAPLSPLQPVYSITNNHILIIYFISFHCDLHLENSTPFFSHDTLAHDDASPHHVWLQKIEWFRKYLLDKACTQGQTGWQT